MIVGELLTRLGFQVDTKDLDKGKSALAEFKQFALGLGIGAALAMVGKEAITAAADVESLTAQFTTMLGSAAQGAQLMSQIQQYAAKTTFESSDIAPAISQYLQYGMSLKDAWEAVRGIGDIAGANRQKFQLLSYAMAQISAAGRLQGQDLRQLIDSGWNPLKQIAEKTGKSMAEMREEMGRGKISYEMVKQAMIDATSAGGMFYKNQERQAQTLRGLWSTLEDNFKIALSKMALAFSPALKSLMNALITIDWDPLVNFFRTLAGVVQYVADVAYNSGIIGAFYELRESISDVVGGLSDGSAVSNWGQALYGLGKVIGYVVTVVLMAASSIVRLIGFMVQAALWCYKWRDAFIAVGIVLAAIFGPMVVTQILTVASATRAAGLANLFFQRAALAGGAAAGYQVTMLGILKAAAFSVSTAFQTATVSLRTFLASGMGALSVFAAAAGIIVYDIYLAKKAMDESKAQEDSNQRQEAAARAIDGVDQDVKEARAARERGDRATAETMQNRINMKWAKYRKILDEGKKPDDAPKTPEDFDSLMAKLQKDASTSMQQTVGGDTKIQNIHVENRTNVQTELMADGKTGLGPQNLKELMEKTMRASVSTHLIRALQEAG